MIVQALCPESKRNTRCSTFPPRRAGTFAKLCRIQKPDAHYNHQLAAKLAMFVKPPYHLMVTAEFDLAFQDKPAKLDRRIKFIDK